ncbi:hypothetical protein ACET65_19810 [Aeromonas rivipollensis]
MSFTPEQLAEGLAEAERRGDTATANAFRARMGTAAPTGSAMPHLDAWVNKCKKRFAHHRQGGQ